jgi:hypothetical protein
MPGKLKNNGNQVKTDSTCIAMDLLYNTIVEPIWTHLPRTMKHSLCKLMRRSYNNIHDPMFYTALHTMWRVNRRKHEKDMRADIAPMVECSICLETVPLLPTQSMGIAGKTKVNVTTLMCGHHFCSPCIFKHIDCRLQSGSNASCPMCRGNVFEPPVVVHTQLQNANAEQSQNARVREKRLRRQHERWTKRQRAKHDNIRTIIPITNTPIIEIVNTQV